MFIDLPAAVLLLTPVFLPLAQSISMDLPAAEIMMNEPCYRSHAAGRHNAIITSALAKGQVVNGARLGPFYLVAFLVLRWFPSALIRFILSGMFATTSAETLSTGALPIRYALRIGSQRARLHKATRLGRCSGRVRPRIVKPEDPA